MPGPLTCAHMWLAIIVRTVDSAKVEPRRRSSPTTLATDTSSDPERIVRSEIASRIATRTVVGLSGLENGAVTSSADAWLPAGAE